MPTDLKQHLLEILKKNSVFYGDFALSSGGRSKYYIDCRLTTLNPEGAAAVGELLHGVIRAEAQRRGVRIDAVGGLTMGADPVALAIGLASFRQTPAEVLQVFTVRKAPKAHGQTKLIEGNFKAGDRVVVVDDVVTKGDSTLRAIEAVQAAGGIVEFAVVLVDREEGGGQNIESKGVTIFPLFKKSDLIDASR
ncbi:MAG TPA: orotate phosphoribosyltransferase [Verrucomicrobiae bacterium]|jgi:orotate phosphoribosyltransferase|nr:orotate phosphoribosyltransferase [Verrucomicrobiae bacterium]